MLLFLSDTQVDIDKVLSMCVKPAVVLRLCSTLTCFGLVILLAIAVVTGMKYALSEDVI